MTVSEEELECIMKATVNEDEGITVPTPKEEAAMIEGLLGMSAGELGSSMVQFVKGHESCDNCGRHFSFPVVYRPPIFQSNLADDPKTIVRCKQTLSTYLQQYKY